MLAAALMFSLDCVGQEKEDVIADGTEGETLPVPDSTGTKRKPWNFFDGSFSTIRIGVAFLYEYGGFSQDSEAKRQMDSADVDLESQFKVRDIRFFFSGQFKTKRTITWKAGVMYDGSLDAWFIRETGVMIEMPEISGHIFVGRTKEGFSLSKVMSGYAVEMMERHMASDPIPILADGIKVLGFLPKQRLLWNVGMYSDWTSDHQSFSTYSWQFAARIGWLPIYSPETNTVLHIAANLRYAQPDDDKIRVRARPELNVAPFFIDTGEFPTTQSNHIGGEIYYSAGPLMLGSEFFWHRFTSTETGNPVFNGGEVVASYILTGESRPYSTVGGIYSFVPVPRPVFKGGPGTWEVLVRYSTLDLDAGQLRGGKFWKVTPMVNWYLTENIRFELAYGYGVLHRFDLKGVTHFFQSRIQFTLR